MKVKLLFLFALASFVGHPAAQAQVKILFDCTKAESAGNADWIIDADLHNMDWKPAGCTGCGGDESNPAQFPTPGQININANTPETYWNGSLSSWAVDCVKRGYAVESLPFTGQITFGSATNPQDLSNYRVFVVDEPNILFTAAEKAAIMNYVYGGGSLFMISDHDQSDRNNDGYDSPAIWNDFISGNGVHDNKTGFTFDLANFSQITSNIPNLPNDSIINGPFGTVSAVKWSNGTTMTLHSAQNTTVRGIVYKTGSSVTGSTGVMCAYARVGCGRVVAMGDSSPADDGTGDPNDQLYNGYTQDANGNHRKLLMNMMVWLAAGPCHNATATNEADEAAMPEVFPNPASDAFWVRWHTTTGKPDIEVYNSQGQYMTTGSNTTDGNGDNLVKISAAGWPSGVYFIVTRLSGQVGYKTVWIGH
jgi:hypothetical protein